MEPLTMAVVGSALTNALMQYYTNKQNVELNSQRFAEQTELANTAHQREVADLRAAGLNPILSTGTAGAAVPSQQSAQVDSPSIGELGNALATAKVSSAQVANANQNLVINQPKAEASKVLSDFYKTEEGQNTLKDIERLKGAPKNPYEAAYLGLSRLNEGPDKPDKPKDNPSSAKPSSDRHDKHFHINFNSMYNAYDPKYRNPDGLRLTH